MNWQRATTDDKKIERKQAIYQAALTLFKQKGYDKVSFNGIASEAGFTKSNVYRYFSSKEDIFLSIFAELFQDWFDDFEQQLSQLPVEAAELDFAAAWVTSSTVRPKFLDLTPLLMIALEQNGSYEQLIEFKTLSRELLYRLTLQISRIYPDIQNQDAFKLLSMSYGAMSNYWAGATENAVLAKIYQQPEFSDLKPNFEYELTTAIEIIIKGLRAK